jgi:hypothetical protein
VQTGRGAFYFIDEFGAMLEKASREAAGNFTSFVLQLFDAPPSLTLSTRSNRITCTNAHGTIVAASTYDYLARTLNEGFIHSGFVNRFLFVTGERTRPLSVRPETDGAAQAALLDRLRGIIVAMRGQRMTLSAEARTLHDELYEADFYRDEDSQLVAEATDRNGVLAVRLAMVLAFADGTTVIAREHIQGAWDFVAYSRQVVEGLLGRMKDKTFEQAEAKVLRACGRAVGENGGVFTRASIRERLRGGNGLCARNFTAAWDALQAAGDIVPLPPTTDGEAAFALAPHHSNP